MSTVLFHEHLVRLHESDVQVVFLHPDLSTMAFLSRIDLTTSQMLQTRKVFSPTSSFTGQRKLAYRPGWQINNFYVMPRQHPANSV